MHGGAAINLYMLDSFRLRMISDRARGAGAPDHGRGSGGRLPCLHVAVDDRSRVAYAELLGDEREETCAAFMGRARDFYRGLGVEVERAMTDDGPGYRSRLFNERLAASGIAHGYARPYGPWQNGKVERMNRTLAQEWQYARLRERGGEGRRPLLLHRPLQLGQAPQRLRRPPADVTHRRCKQRHGTQQLGRTTPENVTHDKGRFPRSRGETALVSCKSRELSGTMRYSSK